MSGPRQSLGRRVFRRMMALIVTIAVLTFVLFNLLLRVYIRASVNAQLDRMVSGLTIEGEGGRADMTEAELSALGIQGNAFLLDERGSVSDILQGDPATVRALAAKLSESGLISGDTRGAKIETDAGVFFVSCIVDKLHPEAYMAFFIDVTPVTRFYSASMLTVTVVLAVAAAVSALGARRFARSLQQNATRLSDYVTRIGRREFDSERPEFKDRELDELARAVERTAGELKDVQNQQTAFFQNVSHELRTPLMSIRCYAEGIACGVMEPAASGETILEETEELTRMVEDLLYISRMEQGAVQRRMDTVDLRDTLSECVSAIRRQAARRGLEFEFRFIDEPVWFTCDEREIAQMYTNLLTNALRYARTRITLACLAEHSEVKLVVADDGEGLTEQDLPHVFERFYKGRGGQHGVGLSIVQSIVELYGGVISVKNDGGARFEVRLPRK